MLKPRLKRDLEIKINHFTALMFVIRLLDPCHCYFRTRGSSGATWRIILHTDVLDGCPRIVSKEFTQKICPTERKTTETNKNIDPGP